MYEILLYDLRNGQPNPILSCMCCQDYSGIKMAVAVSSEPDGYLVRYLLLVPPRRTNLM